MMKQNTRVAVSFPGKSFPDLHSHCLYPFPLHPIHVAETAFSIALYHEHLTLKPLQRRYKNIVHLCLAYLGKVIVGS